MRSIVWKLILQGSPAVMPILLCLHIYLMLEFPSNAPLYENLQGSWRKQIIRFTFVIISFIVCTIRPQIHARAPSQNRRKSFHVPTCTCTSSTSTLSPADRIQCVSLPLISSHNTNSDLFLSSWDLGSPFSTAIVAIRIFGKWKRYEFIYVSLPILPCSPVIYLYFRECKNREIRLFYTQGVG